MYPDPATGRSSVRAYVRSSRLPAFLPSFLPSSVFLPSVYKFLGIGVMVLVMVCLLWWSTRLQIKREEKLKSEALEKEEVLL